MTEESVADAPQAMEVENETESMPDQVSPLAHEPAAGGGETEDEAVEPAAGSSAPADGDTEEEENGDQDVANEGTESKPAEDIALASSPGPPSAARKPRCV